MNVRNQTTKEKTIYRGYIYRQVFQTNFSQLVVLLLLVSIFLQPIERTHASEVVDPSGEVVPVVTILEEESLAESTNILTEEAALVSPEVTGESEEEVIEVATENSSAVMTVEEGTTTEKTQAVVIDTPETPTEEVALPPTAIEETIAEYTAPLGELPPDVPAVDAAGNVTDSEASINLVEESVLEPTATTTILAESAIAVSTVSSDGMIQFDKSDCITVADGSFYCQPQKSSTELAEDGLFALPDRDGDLEIYIQKAGELSQISFNEVDDAAPYFDSLSNTLVWHRLVNDRYQIVAFDIATGEESLLTSDTVNNMEPTRAGKYTVWQRWSGDNWDIVLYDGKNSTILTTALEHDIAPKVRGNLVVWNRLSFDRSQTIELYDIETGEYTTINDKEGGKISNPRMVLVYESTFDNGDIVTKGYDIETREITPLNATPIEIPEEIPTPDSTGETRAFIQGKTTTKEEAESIDFASSTPTINGPDPEAVQATSTITVELSSSTAPVYASTTGAAVELTLDLRPADIESTTEIIDIVVPPFTAVGTATLGEVNQ